MVFLMRHYEAEINSKYRNTMREASDKYRATLKATDDPAEMAIAWDILLDTEAQAHNLRMAEYAEMAYNNCEM
jgi:hypothetical protein